MSMNKIYEFFTRGLKEVSELWSVGTVMLVALVTLGALLMLELAFMTIAIAKRKKRCCCAVNHGRRRTVFITAWIVAAIMFVNLVGYSSLAATIAMVDIMFVMFFMMIVYVMDWVIGGFTVCKHMCCCGCYDGSCEVSYEEEVESVTEKPRKEKKVKEKKVKLIEIEDGIEDIEDEVVVYTPSHGLVMQDRVQIKEEPKPEPRPEPRVEPEVRAERAQPVPSVNQRPSADEIALQKKNDRLEELASRIEKQRLAAVKQADKIVERDDTNYSSERSRDALHTADRTMSKMDELQRRMEALRKTVTTRDTNTTETVTGRREENSTKYSYDSLFAVKTAMQAKSEEDK